MKDFKLVANRPSCITITTSKTMQDLANMFRQLAMEIEDGEQHLPLDEPVFKLDYFRQGLNIRVRCDERLQ